MTSNRIGDLLERAEKSIRKIIHSVKSLEAKRRFPRLNKAMESRQVNYSIDVSFHHDIDPSYPKYLVQRKEIFLHVSAEAHASCMRRQGLEKNLLQDNRGFDLWFSLPRELKSRTVDCTFSAPSSSSVL